MADIEDLEINVTLKNGDYCRQYAQITIGPVKITAYQSDVRAGGVTVEIDTSHGAVDLAVYVNDEEVT